MAVLNEGEYEALVGLISGTNGGIAGVYAGQPLDTVKVKLQTYPYLYRNALHCFIKTLQQDGIRRGLYAGTLPALASSVAENAVLFAALEPCKRLVHYISHKELDGPYRDASLSNIQVAFAGSLSAFFAALVVSPTELVKCRLQAAREFQSQSQADQLTKSRISLWSVIKDIVRKDGAMGFTRGLGPTLVREMPGYFFFFGGYECARSLLSMNGSKQQLGHVSIALCGGVGGLSFWLSIFPIDVVKSRLQVSDGSQYGNMFALGCHIYHTEGIAALYKGLGPTLCRTVPATGALFIVYEWTRKLLL